MRCILSMKHLLQCGDQFSLHGKDNDITFTTSNYQKNLRSKTFIINLLCKFLWFGQLSSRAFGINNRSDPQTTLQDLKHLPLLLNHYLARLEHTIASDLKTFNLFCRLLYGQDYFHYVIFLSTKYWTHRLEIFHDTCSSLSFLSLIIIARKNYL